MDSGRAGPRRNLDLFRCWQPLEQGGELLNCRTLCGRTGPKSDTATGDTTLLVSGLRPGMLRRVKALATMNDQQLGRFVQLMEIARVEQYKTVVPGCSRRCDVRGTLTAKSAPGSWREENRAGPVSDPATFLGNEF